MSFLTPFVKPIIGSVVGGLVGRGIAGSPARPQPVPGLFTDEEKRTFFQNMNVPASIPSINVPIIRPQSSVFFNPFMGDLDRINRQIGALNLQAGRFDPEVFEQIGRLRGDIGGLRERVRPGFSEIREARLSAVDRARQRTMSETRDALARRGVSGSSFALGQLGSLESEFAVQAAEQAAISSIEELQTNITLIDQDRQLVETSIRGLAEQGAIKIAAAEAAVRKADITGRALSSDVESRQRAAIAQAQAEAQVAQLRLQDLQRRQNLFLDLDRLSQENQRFAQELAFRENQGRGELIGTLTGIGANIGLGIETSGSPRVGGTTGPSLTTPRIFANVEDAALPRAATTTPFLPRAGLPVSPGSFLDLGSRSAFLGST